MSHNSNQGQGQGPNADQEGMRGLFIAILLFIVAIFAWTYYQPEINTAVGAIAWVHIYPYAWLARTFPVLENLPIIGPGLFDYASDVMTGLEAGGYAGMTPDMRNEVLEIMGKCAAPVYVPALLWAGIMGRNFRPDVAYRTGHTLESMIYMQSEYWLTSRMIRHVNPLKIPEVSSVSLSRASLQQERRITEPVDCGALVETVFAPPKPGTWQRALRPEEFLVSTGMCRDDSRVMEAEQKNWTYPAKALEARDKWPETDNRSISELLAGQLRSPWTGFEDLRPCHQAIAAAMASFYAYDIKGGNALLDDLGGIQDAVRAQPGKMDDAIRSEEGLLARIKPVLSGKEGKNIREIADKHAWVETAFPAMLEVARKDRGVLPASAFLWLKAEDRLMWYILDNVGSEAIMVEAAGALSHFRAEQQIGLPIRRPAVFQAARALRDDYLDVTEERIRMRAVKEELKMTPEQKVSRLLRDNDAADRTDAVNLEKGE